MESGWAYQNFSHLGTIYIFHQPPFALDICIQLKNRPQGS